MADNLTYDSIVSNINSGRLKNLYLFHGPEVLLINDVLSKMGKKLISPGLKSLNYIKLDAGAASYDSIVNASETLPFMDARKIVVVSESGFFKGKRNQKDNGGAGNGQEMLTDYFFRIPETTILIFIESDDVDKRKKVYNSIKKNGDVVEFSSLKNQDMLIWVMRAFEELGKTINRSDALYFVDRVPGTLDDVMNEVNKLCSYLGGKMEVARQDIDAVVSRSLELNIFQLVDAISMKNPGRALVILNELLLESEPIPLIMAMIIRQYRLLLNTRLLTVKGYNGSEIAGKLGIRTFVSSNLIRISGSYSEEQLQRRLKRCQEIDEAVKTGRMDQRIGVETLIVEFAGTK